MLLGEMAERPKKAGLARLRFDLDENYSPYREGRKIHLPDDPEVEFFLLKGGELFLLSGWGGDMRETFLGGMDETVFLTQLTEAPFYAFLESCGDESVFFDSLVPPVVKRASAVLEIPWVRQGDFYAVRWPVPWGTIELNHHVYSGREEKRERVKSRPIFDTRHRLTGWWLQAEGYLLEVDDNYYTDEWTRFSNLDLERAFVEGVLRAPSHKPLKLLSGPHLLARSECVVNPKNSRGLD